MTGDQSQGTAETIDAMRADLSDRDAFLESTKRCHAIIAGSSGNVLFAYLVDSLLGILRRHCHRHRLPKPPADGDPQGAQGDLRGGGQTR
jgi:DNA-binding FadR family transcriptional regulator